MFHFPISDMTITLDDVSSILYILIVVQFLTYIMTEFVGAFALLVELLRFDPSDAKVEMWQCWRALRLSWLREIYGKCCVRRSWEFVGRAYLMHLVGCTIFTDKSATSMYVSYLAFLRDLWMCGDYCLRVVALKHFLWAITRCMLCS